MKTIQPSHKILTCPEGDECLALIETAGRTAYKSEAKIDSGSIDRTPSSHAFVRMILKRGHESVLEHQGMTVRFITDRAIANELVRHRLASYTQVSTRYVRYGDKHDIEFIEPSGLSESTALRWVGACQTAQEAYQDMLAGGASPEQARSVLPLSLATEVVMTANMREWRHVFRLRCHLTAHPDMRRLMQPLLHEMHRRIPILFDDLMDYTRPCKTGA